MSTTEQQLMSYRIIKAEVNGDTINTDVEYTLADGSTQTVTVSHFRPHAVEDVVTGIENREASEQASLDAKVANSFLLPKIQELISK
jgi:hypothetical protein